MLMPLSGEVSVGPAIKVPLLMRVDNQPFVPGGLTEFRQPLQVQSHLEMPRILVQLGHIQRT